MYFKQTVYAFICLKKKVPTMQYPKNKKSQSGAEHRYPVYDNKIENDLRTQNIIHIIWDGSAAKM